MLRFVIDCLARLPVSLRARLGAVCGAVFGVLPLRDRRIAELQLARFLDSPTPRATAIGTYAEAGRTALTAINLAPVLQDVRSPDTAFLDSFKTLGRPVVALSAHLGVWDLLGAFVVSRGLPVATIGRAARSPQLHAVLAEIRSQSGITTIWRDDPRSTREIIEHLKRNGVIAALIDQDTRVTGTFGQFFGSPAFTPSSLIEIGRRYGALIVTAFIVRREDGVHEVMVEPIEDGLPLDQVLAVYHARLEALIRRYPTQWVWFHKRWRTSPAGTRLSSREYERFLREELARRRAEGTDWSNPTSHGKLNV